MMRICLKTLKKEAKCDQGADRPMDQQTNRLTETVSFSRVARDHCTRNQVIPRNLQMIIVNSSKIHNLREEIMKKRLISDYGFILD